MGNGASCAQGPGPYAIDDMLAHRDAAGDLTLKGLCEITTRLGLELSTQELFQAGIAKPRDPSAARCGANTLVTIDNERLLKAAHAAVRASGSAAADDARAPASPVRSASSSSVTTAAADAHRRSSHGGGAKKQHASEDLFVHITPAEARRGFPRALAALARNPKLAAQPMPGKGQTGSPWLPLHCVLLMAVKWPGWWWRLAEPLLAELLARHPRAAQARVLEGVRYPLGQTALELAVVRGWAKEVVAMVYRAYPVAATLLDPITMPRAKKGSKALVAPLDEKAQAAALAAAVVAAAAAKPASLKGLRWVRKAAEAARPPARIDVLMMLPKPGKDAAAWMDGKEVQREAETKASKLALRDARRGAKKAVRAEHGAAKLVRQAGRGGGGGLSAGSARNHLGNDPGGASASLRRRAAAELLQAAATYGELAAALRRAHGSHVFVTLETEPAVTEALAKFVEKRDTHLQRADMFAMDSADPCLIAALRSPRCAGDAAHAWVDEPAVKPVASPRGRGAI